MKIKGFFINDRIYLKKWIYITFFIFITGIICGTVYCTGLSADSDNSVKKYLLAYFTEVSADCDYFKILKNSLFEYIKLFTVIFLCSFIRPGIFIIGATALLKGFISGFTTAAFIKYYETKGLLASVSSLPSTLLYLPTLLLLCAGSIIFCINRHKQEKNKLKEYIVLAICCLTIFCVASLSDAFITTTFMKIISSFFVG